jgi:N-acylneuraminate cytidylyltransferase
LALDETPDLPVFVHALEWLEQNEGYRPEVVVQLRPTSPLRPPDLVHRAISVLLSHPEADSARAVIPSGQNPYKMWRITEEGRLTPLLHGEFREPYNMPRQLLPSTYWQTGHIDVIRTATILEKRSMSGEVILPILLEPDYAVDIDLPRDHARAEQLLREGSLAVVRPGRSPRPLPRAVKLLVLDFDGVLTDNRVWVSQDGAEQVAAHRGDGWGIARLREHGVEAVVISSEVSPVVAARCKKLGIEAIFGTTDKASALREVLAARGLAGEQAVYVGNDVNDVPCFGIAGCALVVADAHPAAKAEADIILKAAGGFGAVREVCDMILGMMGR